MWYPITSGVTPTAQAGSLGIRQDALAASRCLMNPFIWPWFTSATALPSPCGPPPLRSALSW